MKQDDQVHFRGGPNLSLRHDVSSVEPEYIAYAVELVSFLLGDHAGYHNVWLTPDID